MFTRLTIPQMSLIRSFKREAKRVYFHGLDQNDLPVISFDDAHGHHEPFAVRRRPIRVSTVGVGHEQTVTTAARPFRWFTEEELDGVDPESHDILTSIPRWRG